MKNTAIQELMKRYGHLLPDVEREFLEMEKDQLCTMYIRGRNDCHLDYYPDKHANETYNDLFGKNMKPVENELFDIRLSCFWDDTISQLYVNTYDVIWIEEVHTPIQVSLLHQLFKLCKNL